MAPVLTSVELSQEVLAHSPDAQEDVARLLELQHRLVYDVNTLSARIRDKVSQQLASASAEVIKELDIGLDNVRNRLLEATNTLEEEGFWVGPQWSGLEYDVAADEGPGPFVPTLSTSKELAKSHTTFASGTVDDESNRPFVRTLEVNPANRRQFSVESFEVSAESVEGPLGKRVQLPTSTTSTSLVQYAMPPPTGRERMVMILKSWEFEGTCSTIILLNCISMGFSAHQSVTDEFGSGVEMALAISEHVFTAYFLLECILRMWAFGWRAFLPFESEGRWNFMDLALVLFTGVLTTWIVPLIDLVAQIETKGGIFGVLMLLRAVRLARLIRVFRDVYIFKEAWLLIRGLADSGRTLFWTIVVVFFVTYGFGIMGLILITEPMQEIASDPSTSSEDLARIASLLTMIGGLDRVMYTLVQVLTGDSFHSFMREILYFVPGSWVYFYSYIAFAVIVLMNLVTAIIVENAMQTSANDHEQQLQEKSAKESKQIKELMHIFELMDEDHSGTISWKEFKNSWKRKDVSTTWTLLDFRKQDCQELFQLLDTGNGEISVKDFFDGISRMKGEASARDLFRLDRKLAKIFALLEHYFPPVPQDDCVTPCSYNLSNYNSLTRSQ